MLPDAVLVVGADGLILVANAAATELLGYARHELIGSTCAPLVDARHEDGSPVWAHGWDGGIRLPSVRRLAEQIVTLQPGRGGPLRVAVTGAYRRDPIGRFTGLVLCLRPAAPRSRAGADRSVEVVSMVSHELRSPLTSIKGYTNLLLNRWDLLVDDERRMMLGQVRRDADRVTRLIGELLDISRLEGGRLHLRRQLVDLPALSASVLDKVRLQYPELDARASWPDGFPAVLADSDKVEQVLTNLVENACKYASPRGLVVTGEVTVGEVTVGEVAAGEVTAGVDAAAHASTGHVTVTVADHGVGIPAGDLPRVFTRFFRRSESRPDGSGLGLWISRGLIEAHGGRLTASSILGKGSAFRFTLPLVDLEDVTTP